jgi:hypothetical protein
MPVGVKPADQRAFKYKLKQDPAHIAKINTKQQDRMLAKHEAAQQDLEGLELAAKQVLGLAGVHTCMFINYLNFIRECWSLHRRFDSEALCVEVAVIQLKWKVRGLDNDVLARLRFEVLNINEPKTPII